MTDLSGVRGQALQNHGSPASLRAWVIWTAVMLGGFFPLLVRFGMEQWGRPQYQFFPLMLVAAVLFAWQRLAEVSPRTVSSGRSGTAGVVLMIALALLAVAGVLWSGRLAALAAIIALAGMGYRLGGGAALRALTPSAILLALVIGPPVGVDDRVLQSLRELAVWISSGVLVYLDVPHLVTGTVIEIPSSRLLVAEACSGINSVMAVLGCTLVLAFWRRRSILATITLLISGLVFVLWANVIRIAGGAWLKADYKIDILSGSVHEYTSIILFAVCMGLVISADGVLAAFDAWRRSSDSRPPAPVGAVPRRRPGFAWVPPFPGGTRVLAMLFALVGVAQVVSIFARGGPVVWLAEPGTSHLSAAAKFTVPDQVGPWQRSTDAEKLVAQPEIEGKRSHVWAYRQGDMVAILAMDYPFAGFHDLTVCYRNAGWSIQRSAVTWEQEARQTDPLITVDISRVNEWGYLCYAAIDENGQWTLPPRSGVWDRLQERLQHLGRPDWNACTYQMQAWVHSYDPITPAQQAQLAELFLIVRKDLARQVAAQLNTTR